MDSTQQVLEEIKKQFEYLIKSADFNLENYSYHEANFGNLEAIFSSEKVNIRVIKDRGEFFIDINSPLDQNEWFDLISVLGVLNHSFSISKGINELGQKSELLKKYLPEILQLFEKAKYRATRKKIKDFEVERRKKWLGF